jgi:hypothetical protein
MQTSTPAIARRLTDFLLAGIGHIELANIRDQRLATKGLSKPTDFIASPLHRFVRLFRFEITLNLRQDSSEEIRLGKEIQLRPEIFSPKPAEPDGGVDPPHAPSCE